MLIKDTENFDLKQTFECGQCFRWNEQSEGCYSGVAGDYVIRAYYTDEGIKIDCENHAFASEYFDLQRDYGKMKSILGCDDVIIKAISAGKGIRLIKQQPWEALISFIISANNNIPRIKKIIELLCTHFGEELVYNGKKYYKFPTASALSKLEKSELSVIRSGFRDKYIMDAAEKVVSGTVDLQAVYNMSADEGRAELKKINGVGNKVADCVLLFAYQKYDVFPKDVWIKKILNDLYLVQEKDIDCFAQSKFGPLRGLAQQYLFYYGREML